MKLITHYEVYAAKHGHWALALRFGASGQDEAMAHAQQLEAQSGNAVQVLEENYALSTEKRTVRVLYRSKEGAMDVEPPLPADVGNRIFMIGMNAIGVGVIVAMLMALFLSSLRDSGIDVLAGTYTFLLVVSFLASMLAAGLVLFRVYVPMELILWRNKSAEAQRSAANALLHGPVVGDPGEAGALPALDKIREVEAPPAIDPAAAEQAADGAEGQAAPSSFDQILEQLRARGAESAPEAAPQETPAEETAAAPGEEAPGPAAARPAADIPDHSFAVSQDTLQSEWDAAAQMPPLAQEESLVDAAAAALQAVIAKVQASLTAFAENAFAMLAASRPRLEAFDRFGLNLYFAGAANAAVERNGLGEDIKLGLLMNVLTHTGTSPQLAKIFCGRLNTSEMRPRFRKMMEAGHRAMTAYLEGAADAALPALADLIKQWSDPHTRAADPSVFVFLLTDLVGSTALTSTLGNAGAQKVIRAHNAVVRDAIREYKGTEVKHTGDGILATFPDPLAAARAAIEIQQGAFAHARDNPKAPLQLRVGLHLGEAVFEEGDYHGPAVQIMDGVCGVGDGGQITCTAPFQAKCAIPSLRFTDLGSQPLKGLQMQQHVCRLEWTPKPSGKQPPLEYRQIGATGAPAAS